MEILRIKNLSFSYPQSNKSAINDISFSMNSGDFNIIFGQSGCGKSTLLKLIKNELSPYGKIEGSIYYNSKNTNNIEKKISASEIGFVMQNPDSQIVTDKVYRELAFGLESLGYDNASIKRKVAEIASYFGIENWYDKNTAELSGGQKQLLNLASIMVMNPKLILLDEPTAQLDPIASNNFINTLYQLNKDLGISILMVEHNLEKVFSIADNVILLDNGKLLFKDVPQKIVEYLQKSDNNAAAKSLPCAARIFDMLGGTGNAPLSTKDGRHYILENYKNEIKNLDISHYEHSKSTAIKFKNVYFRYEKKANDILNNVSFNVYNNEHFCILGGNGSGKSTTLNIIAGLLKPYYGKIFINDKKISTLSQKELYTNNIALLPQNPQALFITDNVYDDLKEVLLTNGCNNNKIKNKIDTICNKLSITHLLKTHPYDLSGGEIQKVAIAKLLLSEPKILLLDEPTKGVDAYSRDELGNILQSLTKENMTIITVTHDIEFAAKYANRCGLFFNKELIGIDTPNNFFSMNSFYTTSANKIIKGFFENAVTCDDVVKLCKLNKGAI